MFSKQTKNFEIFKQKNTKRLVGKSIPSKFCWKWSPKIKVPSAGGSLQLFWRFWLKSVPNAKVWRWDGQSTSSNLWLKRSPNLKVWRLLRMLWGHNIDVFGQVFFWNNSLPETNKSPLKNDGWNTSFWGKPIFRGELLVLGRVKSLKKKKTGLNLNIMDLISKFGTLPQRIHHQKFKSFSASTVCFQEGIPPGKIDGYDG